MSKPEVIKIFGGPGTGKTTTMVGNTDIDDFKGILHRKFEEENPRNLMLIAYTRSAADEAKNRLYKLTDVNKNVLNKRITTIHSLTMGMTGIRPNDIVEISNVPYKYHFCNQDHIPLTYSSGGDGDDIMDVPDDDGHMFFRMLSWLKSNMKDVEEWEDCPISSSWKHGDRIVRFEKAWSEFKSSRGKYEFDDVILQAVEDGYTVDCRELFVDEVQDLYPLQQAFLDNQMDVIDRLWLAGDDDQTIYEWAGANPDYFINMEGRVDEIDDVYWDDKSGYWADEGVYILDQSYRMPEDVMNLSQVAIKQVRERQDKEIKPFSKGGNISHYMNPTDTELVNAINPDDTFILCRSNHQASEMGKKLIFKGIPFTDRFKTWRKSALQIRDGLAALYNDSDMMDGSSAQAIISELPENYLTDSMAWGGAGNFGRQDYVGVEEFMDCVTLSKPTSRRTLSMFLDKLQDELNYFQRQAILYNIREGNEDMTPEGITIETIHWSKGQEADTVILNLDSTNSVMDNTIDGRFPDAERRLMYVGMTRTDNNLVLLENVSPGLPTFTARELFTEGWQNE